MHQVCAASIFQNSFQRRHCRRQDSISPNMKAFSINVSALKAPIKINYSPNWRNHFYGTYNELLTYKRGFPKLEAWCLQLSSTNPAWPTFLPASFSSQRALCQPSLWGVLCCKHVPLHRCMSNKGPSWKTPGISVKPCYGESMWLQWDRQQPPQLVQPGPCWGGWSLACPQPGPRAAQRKAMSWRWKTLAPTVGAMGKSCQLW